MKYRIISAVVLFFSFCSLLSAGDKYRIEVEDNIEIFIWQNPDLSRQVVVGADGTVALPLVGRVKIEGFTAEEVEKTLTKKFSKYIKFPNVSVLVSKKSRQQVYIIGEVRKAGAYPFYKNLKLLDLISAANGFTPGTNISQVILIRKSGGMRVTKKINLKKIIKGKDRDIPLKKGDIVYLPRSGLTAWNWFVSNVMPTLTLISTLIVLRVVLP